MFYTITSKLPFIETDNSKRKMLKIFIIGSVLYILLHLYLYSSNMTGLLENIKQYLYYMMALDFGVAYFFSKNSAEEETENTNVRNGDKYTSEQMKAIQFEQMRRMREYSSQQPQQPQQPQQQVNNLFKKKDPATSDKEPDTKKLETKEPVKEQAKKETDEGTDTCIPVYMGKN